jgi:hypothetical protein
MERRFSCHFLHIQVPILRLMQQKRAPERALEFYDYLQLYDEHGITIRIEFILLFNSFFVCFHH